MTLPEDRLIAGETLGIEGEGLFGELRTRPWRFGVRVAAAMLRAGELDQALLTLQELIDNTDEGKELPKNDVYDRLSVLWQNRDREGK